MDGFLGWSSFTLFSFSGSLDRATLHSRIHTPRLAHILPLGWICLPRLVRLSHAFAHALAHGLVFATHTRSVGSPLVHSSLSRFMDHSLRGYLCVPHRFRSRFALFFLSFVLARTHPHVRLRITRFSPGSRSSRRFIFFCRAVCALDRARRVLLDRAPHTHRADLDLVLASFAVWIAFAFSLVLRLDHGSQFLVASHCVCALAFLVLLRITDRSVGSSPRILLVVAVASLFLYVCPSLPLLRLHAHLTLRFHALTRALTHTHVCVHAFCALVLRASRIWIGSRGWFHSFLVALFRSTSRIGSCASHCAAHLTRTHTHLSALDGSRTLFSSLDHVCIFCTALAVRLHWLHASFSVHSGSRLLAHAFFAHSLPSPSSHAPHSLLDPHASLSRGFRAPLLHASAASFAHLVHGFHAGSPFIFTSFGYARFWIFCTHARRGSFIARCTPGSRSSGSLAPGSRLLDPLHARTSASHLAFAFTRTPLDPRLLDHSLLVHCAYAHGSRTSLDAHRSRLYCLAPVFWIIVLLWIAVVFFFFFFFFRRFHLAVVFLFRFPRALLVGFGSHAHVHAGCTLSRRTHGSCVLVYRITLSRVWFGSAFSFTPAHLPRTLLTVPLVTRIWFVIGSWISLVLSPHSHRALRRARFSLFAVHSFLFALLRFMVLFLTPHARTHHLLRHSDLVLDLCTVLRSRSLLLFWITRVWITGSLRFASRLVRIGSDLSFSFKLFCVCGSRSLVHWISLSASCLSFRTPGHLCTDLGSHWTHGSLCVCHVCTAFACTRTGSLHCVYLTFYGLRILVCGIVYSRIFLDPRLHTWFCLVLFWIWMDRSHSFCA